MGSVCCCLNTEEIENYVNINGSVHRNCLCLGCFVQNFLSVYTSLFRRGEVYTISSSIQGTTSMASSASHDNSIPDMYHSPPRPLSYDADPRYIRIQRDGLVSGHEKGSSHIHGESEPLRSDIDRVHRDRGSLSGLDKFDSEDECKEHILNSSVNISSAVATTGAGKIYMLSEDEDVCPTCLEEYTLENPKIMTKCSHHFHLGCIYEWMERSDRCPVCGKAMIFDETT